MSTIHFMYNLTIWVIRVRLTHFALQLANPIGTTAFDSFNFIEYIYGRKYG